jgi:membrane protease YdiL (CAAX protease family)
MKHRSKPFILLLLLLRIDSSQGYQSAWKSHRNPLLLRRNPSISPSASTATVPNAFSFSKNKLYSRPKSTSLSASSTVDVANDKDSPERPDWALDWMPTWLVTLKPIHQLGVAFICYVLHLTVLTQKSITFPFQLIPNSLGHFTSLGLDSLAGIGSLAFYIYLRRATKGKVGPSLLSTPTKDERPWQFPKLQPMARLPGPKSTGVFALYLLVQGYFMTGRFSVFWEDFLYGAAGAGFPMTIPMHRSLVVLMGHLTWIVVGGLILGLVPRPQPFFGGGYEIVENEVLKPKEHKSSPSTSVLSIKDTIINKLRSGRKSDVVKKLREHRWFTSTWDTYWVWWVVGGYFVSSWFFNLADFCNQMLLPHSLFDSAAEGVVSQLINPEHNELLASFVGCLAPCWTAPWWEEILYRGFMLPALCLQLPYWFAVWASGVIFSIHHVSATGAIPLMVLGWTWAGLYTKSGNLLVTILVHAMWNSRVFLGNWLGL